MSSRWRQFLGLALLGCVAFGSVEAWSGVFYLLGLHDSLGRSVWPALLALWGLGLVLSLPLGLSLAWPIFGSAGAKRYALATLCATVPVALGSLALSWRLARSTPSASSVALDASMLEPLSELGARLPKVKGGQRSLLTSHPVTCPNASIVEGVTLVATFSKRGKKPRPKSVCFQADRLDVAVRELSSALLASAERGALTLDIITSVQLVPARHAWLDALKLRPGLDGVCEGSTCLMPWQLLAYGFFSTHRPLDFIPDFQFGVAPERLREALGKTGQASVAGLRRVTTESYAIDLASARPELTRLTRMRRRDIVLSAETLARGASDAESYVLAAQLPDGKFRYTLDPMSGASDVQSFNLARQGGTTLALCELGASDPRVERAISMSLSGMLAHARRRGDLVALTHDKNATVARLSETTLPWVSLLACSQRMMTRIEPEIAGLANFVLALQRESGAFAPAFDLSSGRALPGPEPLYAAGQAVLGLLLLEKRLQAHPSAGLPSYESVHAAAERAMSYVATRYWSHPLRDFFFLEENWHCLAAREALGVHRHAGYESFCWDYVQFKSRLILQRERGVDPDFDGGFGFGNIVPPHNTGAAGFGEALAAALSVRRAQGHSDPDEEALLRRVLGFLLRQQWSHENCFACATPAVIGGVSEHTHSLLTRIDFAQHAWAALGHGGRILGLLPRGE